MLSTLLTPIISAFVVALVATPAVMSILRRRNLVDRPDDHRKLHKGEVVVGGGLAVLIGLAVSLLSFPHLPTVDLSVFDATLGASDNLASGSAKFLLFAAAMCVAGLLDDAIGLRGRQKLMLQIVISLAAVVFCDLKITQIQVFGHPFDLGVFGFVFAVLWLVGAVNAVNLLDGADGFASVIGVTLGIGLALMAWFAGRPVDAVLPAVLAASLLGFLPFNLPPARVFLGDAGSHLIGFTLGVAALRGALKGPATVAFAAVVAIWAIPLIDVGAAIVRRKLSGRSIYHTDRGHLHHRLMARGFSSRRLLIIVAVLCCLTSAGGVISVAYHSEPMAWGSVLAVLTIMIGARLFAESEAKLLARKSGSFAYSLVTPFRPKSPSNESRMQLQGSREWDLLWEDLLAYSKRFELVSVELDVHLPSIHEDYVARWNRAEKGDPKRIWRTEIPLVTERGVFGYLRVAGRCDDATACVDIGELLAGLKPIELEITELIARELGWIEPTSQHEDDDSSRLTLSKSVPRDTTSTDVRDATVGV